MVRRTTRLTIIVMVLGLAACTSPKADRHPAPVSGGTAGLAAWAPCPDLPQQLTGQPVSNFTVDCATIKVPQDWRHPDNGKTFDIALDRLRSSTQSNRIGSLVMNPGGPGGSGMEEAIGAVQFDPKLPAEITNRFDIVGFDPRGVGNLGTSGGHSTEVRCFSDAEQDTLLGAEPDPVSQKDFDSIVALNRAADAPCGRKYGASLPLFSTEEAARDMDAIRIAVGDRELNYLGYSYGTLLGAVYAQLFPTHIRAMVLDGAVDPRASLVAAGLSQASGFEHAFSDFTTWCKANAAKCPISADPRGAVTRALADARTSPLTGPDGRKATAGWVFYAVVSAMYTQQFWGPLGQSIAALKAGNPRGVFILADAYARRQPDGTYTNLFDANAVVNCDDAASTPTVAQVRRYQTQWRAKYPLFGAPLAVGLLTCALWPGKHDPYPTGAAKGAPPILVVGTIGDPATPYAQTGRLASMLRVGHVLTWDGEGHTAYPQTPCITGAVNAYVIDLKLPPAGKICPAK